MDNYDDGHKNWSFGNTAVAVGKQALPYMLLGAAAGIFYKSVSLLVDTPKNVVIPRMMAPFPHTQKSPRIIRLFTQLEPFLSIYIKWPKAVLKHLEFLAEAHSDTLRLLQQAEELKREIIELAGKNGDQIAAAHEHTSLQDELLKSQHLSHDDAPADHRQRHGKKSVKQSAVIGEKMNRLRIMLGILNALLEEAIHCRMVIDLLIKDYLLVLKSFNRYWSQCGAILTADPSVFLSQFVALRQSGGAMVKQMKPAQQAKFYETLITAAGLAVQEIERKRALVDTIMNDGGLPGDLGEAGLANEKQQTVRHAHIDFYQWWLRRHCLTLPTMQIIALEQQWLTPARFMGVTQKKPVEQLKQEADLYHSVRNLLQDTTASDDDDEDDNNTGKIIHSSKLLTKYLTAEGQVIAGKSSDLANWMAMVESYGRHYNGNGGRLSEKAQSTYAQLSKRPDRGSSVKDIVAFWYSRTSHEGWKQMAKSPFAGFQLGIGDMLYLPKTSLDEREAQRLLIELHSIVDTIVTQGLFVAQLKLAQTLGASQDIALLFDENAQHGEAWSEDEVLLETSNNLKQQWSGLEATVNLTSPP